MAAEQIQQAHSRMEPTGESNFPERYPKLAYAAHASLASDR